MQHLVKQQHLVEHTRLEAGIFECTAANVSATLHRLQGVSNKLRRCIYILYFPQCVTWPRCQNNHASGSGYYEHLPERFAEHGQPWIGAAVPAASATTKGPLGVVLARVPHC